MSENQNHTWKAMCELGDYFSRLGGAARPHNMAESEIQLYIGCKLIEFKDSSFKSDEYLDCAFIEAAEPVIYKVDSYLQNVSLTMAEFIPFVFEFYEYADKKLNKIDKTKRWKLFGEYLREINP